ncbi:hypothetical protein B0H10DRAFT_2437905 [Mycena sp. CBHHK59/15]|nr:hypothetical protein B0H10DRAFT_2437905 [Mycena sp. CBHHK59/15]
MSDQPARDANGNLRDAADMEFYESESDTRPLPAPSAPQPRRGDRKRATDKLTESLAAEKADDDDDAFVARPKRSRAKAPREICQISPSNLGKIWESQGQQCSSWRQVRALGKRLDEAMLFPYFPAGS